MIDMDERTLNEILGLEPLAPEPDTYVIRTAARAMQKALCDLTAEDIRLLIGQRIGLRVLLPLAVGILREDPWIMTCYYPGDLLEVCRRLNADDWAECPDASVQFQALLKDLPPAVPEP